MKYSILLKLAAVYTVAASNAADSFAATIDLTPRFDTRVFGGVVSRQTYFTDGKLKFGVHTGSDAEVTASDGGALFRFAALPMASVHLRRSPFPASLGFAPEALTRYREAALGLLPPRATEVTVEQTENPLPINGWQSCRFVVSYRTAQGLMRESFTFLNLSPEQQILIRAAGRQQDWGGIAAREDKLIRRWHVILPEEERSET